MNSIVHLEQAIQNQSDEIAALKARERELVEVLGKVDNWDSHSPNLAIDYGSNGVRDYYRIIARQALSSNPNAKLYKAQSDVVEAANPIIDKWYADTVSYAREVGQERVTISIPLDEYERLGQSLATLERIEQEMK